MTIKFWHFKRSYLVYNLYKIKYIEMIWTWKLKVRPWTHLINYLWLIHSTCLILDTRLIRFNWQIPNSIKMICSKIEIIVVDSKVTECFQWDFKWQWQRCWWHSSPTQTVSNIRHQHRCHPNGEQISTHQTVTITSMLVTDVGDQMCWWQLWDVGDRFNTLRKSST